ncbi:MAG: hypothetical protein ABR608_02160 [Pseudonocardiaceae bacterium]
MFGPPDATVLPVCPEVTLAAMAVATPDWRHFFSSFLAIARPGPGRRSGKATEGRVEHVEMAEPRQETFRATLRTRTPEGEWTTLIVTRQGQGSAGRTWLTFHGAIKTTAVLTSEEAAQLVGQLGEASGGAQ